MGDVCVLVPIKLRSYANQKSHWTKAWSQKNKDIQEISYFLKPKFIPLKPPYLITLTRIAPRALDDDNNIAAFKHIRDYIAKLFFPQTQIGKADSYDCFEWKYFQRKGKPKEYFIEIKIEEKCG